MTTKQQQQQHVSRFLEAPFVRMLAHVIGELKNWGNLWYLLKLFVCNLYNLYARLVGGKGCIQFKGNHCYVMYFLEKNLPQISPIF